MKRTIFTKSTTALILTLLVLGAFFPKGLSQKLMAGAIILWLAMLCGQFLIRHFGRGGRKITIDGIRVPPAFADEGIALINDTIAGSGILKELSRSLFGQMDINLYDSLLLGFQEKLLLELQIFYDKNTVLQADFEHPEEPPQKICLANNCIWQDGQWVPVEMFRKAPAREAV